jgi:hypothetical protein
MMRFILLGVTLGVSKPLMRCCVLNVLSDLRIKYSRTLCGDWNLRALDVHVVRFWDGWLCVNLPRDKLIFERK